MVSGAYVFSEYVQRAEAKLGSTCRIAVYQDINKDLLRVISEIEDENFRSELRYSER